MLRSEICRLCGPKWALADMSFLPADASDRKFIRLAIRGATLIVIDSSQEKEKIPPYVAVSSMLIEHNFSAPTVYNVDYETGYLVVEDLGPETLGKLAARDPSMRARLYESVIDILPALQALPRCSLVPEYTVDRLLDELRIFVDWYCPASCALTQEESHEFIEQWREILAATIELEEKAVFVHKDFHFDNLIWLANRRGSSKVGVLDFQDAKYGSAIYDLTSILEDPRYPLCDSSRREFAKWYKSHSVSLDTPLERLYAVYAVQRSLKILGNIYYLALRKGKKSYLSLEANLRRTIAREISEPSLSGVRDLLTWKGLIT